MCTQCWREFRERTEPENPKTLDLCGTCKRIAEIGYSCWMEEQFAAMVREEILESGDLVLVADPEHDPWEGSPEARRYAMLDGGIAR